MAKAIPEGGRVLLLDAMRAALLDLGTLHLFQNDFNPGPFSAIADFTEATFSGYAAVAIPAWGGVFVTGDGGAKTVAPSTQFDHSGAAVANMIYGWYYTEVGGALVMGERLANAPIDMSTALHSLVVLPDLGYGTSE